MDSLKTCRFICFILLFAMGSGGAGAEEFTNAIEAYLQYYVHAQLPHGCIVVGLVDEQGPRVLSCGDLDNGTGRQADGDTLFQTESTSFAFFLMLLQDMVEHGEMRPDDPAEKYLPAALQLPTFHGQQITLRQLAKEVSGLRPALGDALDPQRADAPFEGFTAEKFYALVSKCRLTSAPGTTHAHGGIDSSILNQAVALRGGMDYEALLTARLLRPLNMQDTRLSLTPEVVSRVAPEHCKLGWALPLLRVDASTPLARPVYSTVNDLLKMLSACGITSSQLRPLWENAVTNFAFAPQRVGMLHAGGGWFANGCFLGFDKERRRGVVVLANAYEPRRELALLLLESEWQSGRRPAPAKIDRGLYPSFAGQYQRSPDFALGTFVLRHCLPGAPWTVTVLPAGLSLAVLAALLWRAKRPRRRRLVLAGAVVFGTVSLPFLPMVASCIFCARFHPGFGIRCEGDRLFAESTGSELCAVEDWPNAKAWGQKVQPIDVLFPPVPVELLPASGTGCFERLSGVPMTFDRDGRGAVTRVALHYRGKACLYRKISDVPPKAPEPIKPPVIVNLGTNVLDACAGHYEVAPGDAFPNGLKLTVWREGTQLLGRAQPPGGDRVILGVFPLFPESETNFVEKLTGAQFRFTKNEQGQVTALAHHYTGATLAWFPDWEAKKLK
jgi:CubicO group peptidase (beta-lactamase class C family)